MEISDRKCVAEGNLTERRYLTERSLLKEKPDRKKAISDRKKKKKDVSEENLMETWRFLTERRFFLGEKPDRKKVISGTIRKKRKFLREI